MNSDSRALEETPIINHPTHIIQISQESKRIISVSLLNHINRNPGIRYRELLRLSGIGNGVLTYHLLILERKGKIRVHRIRNKMTRYYLTQIPDKDTKIISSLKNKMTRQLVLFILTHDMCSFRKIVECNGKAPSTISWYLNRLRDVGIVSIETGERCQLYTLADSKEIKKILCRYKEVFLDKCVHNYIEMMDQL